MYVCMIFTCKTIHTYHSCSHAPPHSPVALCLITLHISYTLTLFSSLQRSGALPQLLFSAYVFTLLRKTTFRFVFVFLLQHSIFLRLHTYMYVYRLLSYYFLSLIGNLEFTLFHGHTADVGTFC